MSPINDIPINWQLFRQRVSPLVISGLSEGCQRVIIGLSESYQCVIRELSVGYQWIISGLSVGCQRVISGLSEGYQQVIRGLSEEEKNNKFSFCSIIFWPVFPSTTDYASKGT